MERIAESPGMKILAGILAGILGVIVIGTGGFMTWLLMARVFPESRVMQSPALAFFDGGALAWAGSYIYLARGSSQRGITQVMMWFDLVGVIAMAIGEIYLGGQQLVHPPTWLGNLIITAVIITFISNLTAWYYYHQKRPEILDSIRAQAVLDREAEIQAENELKLQSEAMKQARQVIEREASQLGAVLARRATARIKNRMRLAMTEQERAEWEGETVDGQFTADSPALPGPETAPRVNAWQWLKSLATSFFGRGQSPQPMKSEPTTSTQPSDSNSEEPGPAPAPQEAPPENHNKPINLDRP